MGGTASLLRDATDAPPCHKYEDGSQINSIVSRYPVNIVFRNTTQHMVEIYWLNYKGNEVTYGKVQPQRELLIHSFLTHPWTFRSASTLPGYLADKDGKTVVFPRTDRRVVEITEAKIQEWSTENHKLFKGKADFYAGVKELLNGYTRLHKLTSRVYHKLRKWQGDLASTRGTPNTPQTQSFLQLHASVVKEEMQSALAEATPTLPRTASGTSSAESSPRGFMNASDDDLPAAPADTPVPATLGDLPFDLILDMIKCNAPCIPVYVPVKVADMMRQPPDGWVPGMHMPQVPQQFQPGFQVVLGALAPPQPPAAAAAAADAPPAADPAP